MAKQTKRKTTKTTSLVDAHARLSAFVGGQPFVTADPSASALGLALWVVPSGLPLFGDKPVKHALVESVVLPKGWDSKLVLAQLRAWQTSGAKKLICEDQFIGANPRAVISVLRSRMMVEVTALLMGWQVELLLSTEWQSKMLHVAGEKFNPRGKTATRMTHIPPREILKQRSVALASTVTHKDLSDDEADAICIGLFVLDRYTKGTK